MVGVWYCGDGMVGEVKGGGSGYGIHRQSFVVVEAKGAMTTVVIVVVFEWWWMLVVVMVITIEW